MENREYLANATAAPPTRPVAPSGPYAQGGITPTKPGPYWFHQLGEELRAVVTAAGVVPDGAVLTQLVQAIRRMAGANVTTVTFALSPFNLTADHAGLVLVDCTGGNVVVNYPAANAVTALPLEYTLELTANTANTLTGNCAGADLIDGAASFVMSGQYASRTTRSNSVNAWFTTSGSAVASAALGQCRMIKSGANQVLLPFNGNQITIAGVAQTIPDAGVLLAPTGLVINTNYFIYAYMVGAVMTLEASVTGHSTSTTAGNKGVEIKTGDNTRTLVGQARIITGIAWQDTAQQRFTLSWFNRRQIAALGQFTTLRTISSAGYGEINAEIRAEYLTWADEAADVQLQGQAFNSTSGTLTYTGLGIDSSTIATREVSQVQQAIIGSTGTAALQFRGLQSEGYHYATLLGKVSGSTGNWYADSTVSVMLRG